jgi:lipopolysaccharide biosynthesis regulator YciM
MDLIMNPDILQVTYCSLAILCSMGNKIPNAKHFFEKAKQISKNALLIKRVESYMEFHFGDYGEAIRISKTILDTLNEQESSEFVSEEQIKLDIEYFQKYNGN